MTDLFGFPSAEVLYRADGSIDGSDGAARALAADPGVTDLLVITHGWNNDVAGRAGPVRAARPLAAEVVDDGHGLPPGRTLGILGAIWPSRQFALPEQMQGVAAGRTRRSRSRTSSTRSTGCAPSSPARTRAWTGRPRSSPTWPRTCRRARSSPTWCAGS